MKVKTAEQQHFTGSLAAPYLHLSGTMEEEELLSSLALDGQATLKDDTAAWLAEQGCPALSEETLQAIYGHELQPLWTFIREHKARACKTSKCHSSTSLLQPALQPVNLEPEVRPEPRWYQELERLQVLLAQSLLFTLCHLSACEACSAYENDAHYQGDTKNGSASGDHSSQRDVPPGNARPVPGLTS